VWCCSLRGQGDRGGYSREKWNWTNDESRCLSLTSIILPPPEKDSKRFTSPGQRIRHILRKSHYSTFAFSSGTKVQCRVSNCKRQTMFEHLSWIFGANWISPRLSQCTTNGPQDLNCESTWIGTPITKTSTTFDCIQRTELESSRFPVSNNKYPSTPEICGLPQHTDFSQIPDKSYQLCFRWRPKTLSKSPPQSNRTLNTLWIERAHCSQEQSPRSPVTRSSRTAGNRPNWIQKLNFPRPDAARRVSWRESDGTEGVLDDCQGTRKF
jgi:hypothetical protein